MTHPLDLDELAVVDKMHLTYLASNVMGNLLLAGVGEDIDMLEWVPYVDQTFAGVDIDPTVTSCLWEDDENFQ